MAFFASFSQPRMPSRIRPEPPIEFSCKRVILIRISIKIEENVLCAIGNVFALPEHLQAWPLSVPRRSELRRVEVRSLRTS